MMSDEHLDRQYDKLRALPPEAKVQLSAGAALALVSELRQLRAAKKAAMVGKSSSADMFGAFAEIFSGRRNSRQRS